MTAPPRARLPALAERTTPLLPHECQQAGYQLGRKSIGRPIENPVQIQRLVDATETTHLTRTAFWLGRGNLVPDNEAAHGAAAEFTHASYLQLHKHGTEAHIASALVLGTAHCDQFGVFVGMAHTPRLQPGEVTQMVATSNHVFAQLRMPQLSAINMDAWSNGPPVEEGDSFFRNPKDADLQFDAISGQHALQAVHAWVAAYATPGHPLHHDLQDALTVAPISKLQQYRCDSQVVRKDLACLVRISLSGLALVSRQP